MLWVAVALVSTSGGQRSVAPAAPPIFAIAEPAVRAPEPPRITVAPAPSITARVLANGEPVADAEVSISDGSKPLLATARSDRDGIVHFAELEPGAYELWASHGTTASTISRVMDVTPDSRIDIVLDQPAAALSGVIVGEGELPTEASVQLVPMDLDHATRIAIVDAKGAFAFSALPHGTWRVEVSAPGHVQMAEQTVAIDAAPEELVVRLQRTAVVTGTAVDARGTPVANATIVLRDQSGSTAQRPIALTASRLRWIHPLAGARVLPGGDGGRFGAVRPGQRPAECGRGHCGLDLGMVRGSIVHAVSDGHVSALFHENRTEAGRVVVIHHGGGLRSFYMHLDEIRPGLEVGQPIRAGDPVGTLGSTGVVRSAPHLHFAITHESAGRTWYLDPEPMLRAAVVLPAARPYDPVDAALAAKVELATPTVATITTDDKGVFRVEGVAPGAYVAAGFAPDLAPGVSSPFSVRSGDDVKDVVVRLADGVLVHGRVVGRDGPIAGATVIAGAGMGESAHKIATTTTDKYGEYTLRSLAGKLTLTASAPMHGEAERAIAVLESRDQQREDFKLIAEDGQLRGVVLAPDGGAASGVGVRVVEGTTRRRTVSDTFGRFTIAPVTSGRYVVELASVDYPPKRVTIESDRFSELRVDAGGGARALIRDGQSGAPMSNVRVEAAGPGGQTVARSTDAHGLVELRGLKVGEWKLAVRASGYVAAAQQVTVRTGRGLHDVTFDLVRGSTLAGEVRDHFGRRVAGARVTIGDVSTVTDGEGAFRITGAQSGVLEAESDGRQGSLNLQLSPGDERLSLTVNLSE
ncbi:MAG TPA: carboxypeptidase regulatory-like domain-containing protein [Kofleriaceae bacterium]